LRQCRCLRFLSAVCVDTLFVWLIIFMNRYLYVVFIYIIQWLIDLVDRARVRVTDGVRWGHHDGSVTSWPVAGVNEGESRDTHEEEDQTRHRRQSLAAADQIQSRRQSEW